MVNKLFYFELDASGATLGEPDKSESYINLQLQFKNTMFLFL